MARIADIVGNFGPNPFESGGGVNQVPLASDEIWITGGAHTHSQIGAFTSAAQSRIAHVNAQRQEEMSQIELLRGIQRNTDRICADDNTILRPPKTGLDMLRQEIEDWCGNVFN